MSPRTTHTNDIGCRSTQGYGLLTTSFRTAETDDLRPRVALCAPWVGRRPDAAGSLLTLGLLYLGNSAHRAGWSCTIVDADYFELTPAQAAEACLVNGPPDLLGFAIHSELMLEKAIAVRNEISGFAGKCIPTVAGGIYASAKPDAVLSRPDGFDFVIRHEGEVTFQELLEALARGTRVDQIAGVSIRCAGSRVVHCPDRSLVHNLDNLGDMDFSLVPELPDTRSFSLVTSRGCSSSCSFCVVGPHWGVPGLWRGHSAGWIMRQLSTLATAYQATAVQFVDDAFVSTSASVDRAWELTHLLEQNPLGLRLGLMCRSDVVVANAELFAALYRVGLRRVFLGLETGNSDNTRAMAKGTTPDVGLEAVKLLTDIGIEVVSGTIFFHPWTTIDSLRDDINYFRSLIDSCPGFFFRAIGEADVFSTTSLGKSLGSDNGPWLVPWSALGNAQQVRHVWTRFRDQSLLPYLRALPPGRNVEAWRTAASMQLNVLEGMVQGVEAGADTEDLLIAGHAAVCRQALQAGGSDGLARLVQADTGANDLHGQELCLV